ncbi:MAG: peptidylprolyl isomerase [Pseudomonadota bacterium]
MKKVKAEVVVLVLAFLLATTSSVFGKTIDSIAAVVNDEAITETMLARKLAAKRISDKNVSDGKTYRRTAIEQMIDNALMNQLMKSADIEVTEDDLVRAIANVLQQNRMTIDQLKAEVTAKGMTYEDYKKEIEGEIRKIKFINQVIGPQVKITEQDIRDFYQRNQEKFRGSAKAHIAQIFLPFDGIETQEQADALKATALSIVSNARKGKSFKELAKKYSKGPNPENGGDLGMISLKDVPQPVADTVRSLRVGEVSNPILVENGLVIVKLISQPELSNEDFAAARDRIYSAIYDERVEETLTAYLQKERQKAFIEIR